MQAQPRIETPPLWGLVLAGGESRRMGADKGSLRYHGTPQVRWAYALLAALCARAYVAVRQTTAPPAPYRGLPLLEDVRDRAGPVAGLVAASRANDAVAWLVLAVDMPLVDTALLAQLVAARDPSMDATVFRHGDGPLEPLCAVWEPRAVRALALGDEASPRRFLQSRQCREIVADDHRRLLSANSPAADRAARRWLDELRAGHLGE